MKISLDAKELLNVLRLIKPFSEVAVIKADRSGVVIEGAAGEAVASIKMSFAKVDEGGELAVKVAGAIELLKGQPGAVLFKDNAVTIGGMVFRLDTKLEYSVWDWGVVSEGLFELPVDGLMRVIVQGTACAGAPRDFPKYAGVSLLRAKDGKILCTATDNTRINLSTALCDKIYKESDRCIDAKMLGFVGKVLALGSGEVMVSETTSRIYFWCENVKAVLPLKDIEFPKFSRIVRTDEAPTRLKVNKKALLMRLKKLMPVAKASPGYGVLFRLRPGEEIQMGSATPKGKARAILFGDVRGVGVDVAFNAKYIMDALAVISSDELTIWLYGSESQGQIFSEDNCKCMLMPLHPDVYLSNVFEEECDANCQSEEESLSPQP